MINNKKFKIVNLWLKMISKKLIFNKMTLKKSRKLNFMNLYLRLILSYPFHIMRF